MSWWGEKAARLQRGVRADEAKLADFSRYDSDEVRRSIVHTREDVVLLIGHLDAVNMQLRMIKWLLAGIAALLAYWVFR